MKMKKKGMAKGGAMKKKGYAMGGMKKGYAMGGMKKKMKAGGGVKKFNKGKEVDVGETPVTPDKRMPFGPKTKSAVTRRVDQFLNEDAANTKKFSDRGTSGAAAGKKQGKKIMQKASADMDSLRSYGKDAPKGRSFGQKVQPKQGEMKTPVETLKPKTRAMLGAKKGGSIKKMKAGGMPKKKGFAPGGKVAKKGKAKGGKMGGKSSVRGAGIAQRGVRPAKMR